MHKFIKLSFLSIILLFLFSTYSQSETNKLIKEIPKFDLKKDPSKSAKRGFQPQDFKFLIPLAILLFAVISGMRSAESAEKKNKLSESKEKPIQRHKVRFDIELSQCLRPTTATALGKTPRGSGLKG